MIDQTTWDSVKFTSGFPLVLLKAVILKHALWNMPSHDVSTNLKNDFYINKFLSTINNIKKKEKWSSSNFYICILCPNFTSSKSFLKLTSQHSIIVNFEDIKMRLWSWPANSITFRSSSCRVYPGLNITTLICASDFFGIVNAWSYRK